MRWTKFGVKLISCACLFLGDKASAHDNSGISVELGTKTNHENFTETSAIIPVL
jgi:hypothetical protein